MKRIASSAAAMALAAMALVGTAGPSSAATQHCPDHTTADKVELKYNTTSVYVGAWAKVCYKSGTRIDWADVGADGMLTSELYNRIGNRMDISYYIVTSYCPPSES